MGITHVIRGDDHISNTPRQVALYGALGYPVPVFAHLSTILGPDRERLSKRHGATSIASFREMGILPEALGNYLALLGWGPEGGTRETFSLPELVEAFRLERVTPSPAVFDWAKLEWLNRHYIKEADGVRLRELAWPHFQAAGLLPAREAAGPELVAWVESLVALLLTTINKLDELPGHAEPVFARRLEQAWTSAENEQLLRAELSVRVLDSLWAQLERHAGPLTPEALKELMAAVKAETGAKGKDLFHPVRVVLTGAHSGPEFDKLLPVMERGSTLPQGQVEVPSARARFARFRELREQV
jgi:glutamyl/glutaminyl-tRNA synthetase